MKSEKQRQKRTRKREIVKGLAAMVVMSTFIYVSVLYSITRRSNNENRRFS